MKHVYFIGGLVMLGCGLFVFEDDWKSVLLFLGGAFLMAGREEL